MSVQKQLYKCHPFKTNLEQNKIPLKDYDSGQVPGVGFLGKKDTQPLMVVNRQLECGLGKGSPSLHDGYLPLFSFLGGRLARMPVAVKDWKKAI